MAVIGELATLVVAKTKPFERGMNRARRDLRGFVGSVKGSLGPIAALTSGLTIAGSIKFGVQLAQEAEKAQTAFKVMLGGAIDARKSLKELNAFSAATPFEPEEVRRAGQSLLSFGVDADNLIDRLRTLGDLAAGSGSRLSELISIFGKVRDRGKISGETLNEFGLRAIPLTKQLAKQFEVSGEEIQKMASQGRISFKDMMTALEGLRAEGGLFNNAMEEQSQTLDGLKSTLMGELKLAFEEIGQVIVKEFDFKGATRDLIELIKTLRGATSETSKLRFGVESVATAYRALRLGADSFIDASKLGDAVELFTGVNPTLGRNSRAEMEAAQLRSTGKIPGLVEEGQGGTRRRQRERMEELAKQRAKDVQRQAAAEKRLAHMNSIAEKRASQLAKQLQTPIETFAFAVREARLLNERGFLSDDTFNRRLDQLLQKAEKDGIGQQANVVAFGGGLQALKGLHFGPTLKDNMGKLAGLIGAIGRDAGAGFKERAKAFIEERKDIGPTLAAATQMGSVEAFSAIQRGMGTGTVQEKQLDTARKTLHAIERLPAQLKQLAANVVEAF